jgi:hypothetical protein
MAIFLLQSLPALGLPFFLNGWQLQPFEGVFAPANKVLLQILAKNCTYIQNLHNLARFFLGPEQTKNAYYESTEKNIGKKLAHALSCMYLVINGPGILICRVGGL